MVSFIIHIFAQLLGFPDPSRQNRKKWSSWPSCDSHQFWDFYFVFKKYNKIISFFLKFSFHFAWYEWYLLIGCLENIEKLLRVKGAVCNSKCFADGLPGERHWVPEVSSNRAVVSAQRHLYIYTSSCDMAPSPSFFSCLSKIFVLIIYMCSLQAFSNCWAKSPSPSGGTRAHYTVGSRRLVQFSCSSLPIGNCSFYDGNIPVAK